MSESKYKKYIPFCPYYKHHIHLDTEREHLYCDFYLMGNEMGLNETLLLDTM